MLTKRSELITDEIRRLEGTDVSVRRLLSVDGRATGQSQPPPSDLGRTLRFDYGSPGKDPQTGVNLEKLMLTCTMVICTHAARVCRKTSLRIRKGAPKMLVWMMKRSACNLRKPG